jgi:hypothetical protein
VNDTLLTLEEARAALIGDAAAGRSNAWPSIKTLRRAYSAGRLAVVQPVPGGRVMVWRSELVRWASAPRAPGTSPSDAGAPQARTASLRKPARRRSATPASKRPASAAREREGVPPRLSLAEVSAA